MQLIEIDRTDDQQIASVRDLMCDAFGAFEPPLLQHIALNSGQATRLYGILDGDKLVAANCFIGHSVHRNGEVGIAYQSCLSGTRKSHLGKGLFSRIIEHAKVDLAAKSGAFIFGYPNGNSGPIFTKKLGFSRVEVKPIYFARFLPGSALITPAASALQSADSPLVSFDWHAVAAWKADWGTGFFQYEYLTNFLFGRVTTRRFRGLPMRVLVIGGIEINKPLILAAFLSGAMKAAGVRLARINANSSGAFARMTRLSSSGKTEPIIAFGLNWSVHASEIEAFGGVKDVF